MTEINQEVHNDQKIKMSLLRKELEAGTQQTCSKQNSSGKSIKATSSGSPTDPDSGFENISPFESSNPSSDESFCLSTASSQKQDENPLHAQNDSDFENTSSVESSNQGSLLSSSDDSPGMSTSTSTLKQDESPSYESPSMPCSEELDFPYVSTIQPLNEEENHNRGPSMPCSEEFDFPYVSTTQPLNEEENHNRAIKIVDTNDKVDECRKDIKRKLIIHRRELNISCLQKKFLQGNWKYLKKNIELSMFQDFVEADLVAKEDDPKYVRSETRSKKTDMLVMRVIQRVENDSDLEKFKMIVGQAVWEKLVDREPKKYETDESEQDEHFSWLKSSHDIMIKDLRSDDLEMVKDWFVEEFIIGIKDNDEITNHPGFCDNQNKMFTEYFVKEFIIKKSKCGSYQCLLDCLEEKVGKRCTRLKRLLHSLKRKDIAKTDACIKAPVVSLQVLATNSPEVHQDRCVGLSNKDCTISFQLQRDDKHTKKVYDEVVSKAKTKNGLIRQELGGIISNTKLGSVVIHMVALERDMIQNIIDKIRTGKFANIVNLLLNDVQIKRYLPVGKNELKVTCFPGDKQTRRSFMCSHQFNPIADNKSFIEEEMDTLYVMRELKKRAVNIGIDVNDGDREFRARFILEKALSDETVLEMLYQVLLEGESTHVKHRLMRYKTVYESDSCQLETNICRYFDEISKNVFLDDIRLVFTERNIIKDEIFDEADEQSEQNNEVAMANILTEIILVGTDAMLTLVDALYVIQFDKLADKLITRDVPVQKKMKREFMHNTKQTHRTNSDEIPLAIGKYELIVRRRRRPNKKLSVQVEPSKIQVYTRLLQMSCKKTKDENDIVITIGKAVSAELLANSIYRCRSICRFQVKEKFHHPRYVMPESKDFMSCFYGDFLGGREAIGLYRYWLEEKICSMLVDHIISMFEVENMCNTEFGTPSCIDQLQRLYEVLINSLQHGLCRLWKHQIYSMLVYHMLAKLEVENMYNTAFIRAFQRIWNVQRSISENKGPDDIENAFGRNRTDIMSVVLGKARKNSNDDVSIPEDTFFLLVLEHYGIMDGLKKFPVTDGLRGPENEITENFLPGFINDELHIYHMLELGNVQRLCTGTQPGKRGRPSPIVAMCIYQNYLAMVLSNTHRLQGKQYGVNKQFPEAIEQVRKSLYHIMKEMKAEGHRVRLVRDILYVDGVIFNHKTLNSPSPKNQRKVLNTPENYQSRKRLRRE